jgi:hypothetical protein
LIVPSISTVVFFEHVAAEALGVAATVKEIATVDATRAAPNFANFFIFFLSKGVLDALEHALCDAKITFRAGFGEGFAGNTLRMLAGFFAVFCSGI